MMGCSNIISDMRRGNFYSLCYKIRSHGKELLYKLRRLFRLVYLRWFYRKPFVYTCEDTINIAMGGVSLARYGDGEFAIMLGGSIGFQDGDCRLQNELRRCFKTKSEKLLVCTATFFVKREKGMSNFMIRWARDYAAGIFL